MLISLLLLLTASLVSLLVQSSDVVVVNVDSDDGKRISSAVLLRVNGTGRRRAVGVGVSMETRAKHSGVPSDVVDDPPLVAVVPKRRTVGFGVVALVVVTFVRVPVAADVVLVDMGLYGRFCSLAKDKEDAEADVKSPVLDPLEPGLLLDRGSTLFVDAKRSG